MKRNDERSVRRTVALAALALVLLPLLGAPPAKADDRDLVRTSNSQPYVFILFDATGSMWRRTDDTTPPDLDDDPESRMFLAKEALYEVLDQSEGVSFGFGTFPNVDGVFVSEKNCGDDCVCRDREEDDCSGGGWNVGYPGGQTALDEHCTGWEGLGDTTDDKHDGYRFGWADGTTPVSNLPTGDIVPLDWNDNNVERIQRRLAPNLAIDPNAAPNFHIEDYFEDSRQSGEDFLRLKPNIEGVFMAHGFTPLAGALSSFQSWYDTWEAAAIAGDPQFDCKQVFVLLLTDGSETCDEDPTLPAASLLENDLIQTYVIGFSVDNPALNDIAAAGGTGEAYFPDNKDELVEDFNTIISQIQGKARTFASATVPSVVGRAGRQVFHTNFNPATGQSVWPGRIDAYVRPVPLANINNSLIPDFRPAKACSNSVTEACHLWDAGEAMLPQAPSQSEIDSGTLRVGAGRNARRIFYRRADNGNRRFFRPPGPNGNNARRDLYRDGFGLFESDPDFIAKGDEVIHRTLVEKQTTIRDPFTDDDISKTYILGDVFHSNPTIVTSPNNFRYFSSDLVGRAEPCGPRIDGESETHLPYACFAAQHEFRRRVLIAGANDGQLHGFDAGRPSVDADGNVTYDGGTGRELFAYIPRQVLPKIREIADAGGHRFSVDGPVTVDDALIDGEWRTLVVGGLREGGAGYYALDVTQPDTKTATGIPTSTNEVPSCLFGDRDNLSDCAIPVPFTGVGPFEPRDYPTVQWEFTDTWDEDGNGAPDLGDAWSRPNTGRIRVCFTDCDPLSATNDIEDRYVAVFGGGMDPEFKRNPINDMGTPGDTSDDQWTPWSGNYLYIVDVEDGAILYKQRLDNIDGNEIGTEFPAMAPSEPAAVDLDQDSYLDTIYLGTTSGFFFKTSIGDPMPLETFDVPDYSGGLPATMREVTRIRADAFKPFRVFDTGGRPIYFPPSVIFVAKLGSYALAFGTGDREDLWDPTGQEGRFYVIVDEDFDAGDTNLPLDESDYVLIDPDLTETPNDPDADFILAPNETEGDRPGWVMNFQPDERVLDKSFSISGVIFFTTFNPDLSTPEPGVCGSTGSSRVFLLFVNNANSVATGSRYQTIGDLVTRPYVEPGITVSDAPSDPTQPPDTGEDPCDSAAMAAVTQTMKSSLFPGECDFANYSLNVMTIRSESGIECVAPVPLCIIERNWKEF